MFSELTLLLLFHAVIPSMGIASPDRRPYPGIVQNIGLSGCNGEVKNELKILGKAIKQIQDKLSVSAGRCPDTFKYFSEKCYFFGTIPAKWSSARAVCKQLGAELVAVETYAEDQFIRNHLIKLGSQPGVNGYFTGGNDIQSHGTWVWDSTGKPIGNYRPFVTGQGPNGQATNSGQNVHVYWMPDKARWHDHPPTATNCGFICEK